MKSNVVDNKKSETKTVEQYLTEAMKKNPETGEILLDQIEKDTGFGRLEVVKQLKAFKTDGKYITGRRGHPSRFIWGEKLKEAPKPVIATQKSGRKSNASIGSSEFNLEIGIAGIPNQRIILPVTTRLVEALK